MSEVQEGTLGGVAKPERRRYRRHSCSLPVEIKVPGVSFASQGETTDVSQSGCYISTRFNMAVGTEVELKVWVGDIGLQTKATVRTSDPGVGNGMEFTTLDEAGRQVLSDYFDRLEDSPRRGGEESLRDLLIT